MKTSANRRASRLLAPMLALVLVGAAVAVAFAPVPLVDARLAVGVLLVLAAATLARIVSDVSRTR